MFSASSSYVEGNLQAIVAAITAGATRAVQSTSQIVLMNSQALVPVDTGELLASGSMEIVQETNGPTGYVKFDAPHAPYVEFGTGIRGASSAGAGPGPYRPDWAGMPSQPYLRPALDEAAGTFPGNVAYEVESAL